MNPESTENKVEEKKIPEQTTNELKTPEQSQESAKEINWKKFKEARDQERKQAEEVAKKAAEKEAEVLALKAAMESILNKPTNAVENGRNAYSNDEEESEDQRIEKKVNALLAQKERQQEELRIKQEQESLPQKLKSIHKDFDQVCSSSNLDYLEYHHPELARSLGSQPQGFDKWNDIYSAIKRYVPNLDAKKEQAKAEANFNKPQSISSSTMTQTGISLGSNRLSEERKAANWARMEKARKGLS